MNSRRRILQFLGLGSLFGTVAAVTPNQARADKGMEPLAFAARGPAAVTSLGSRLR